MGIGGGLRREGGYIMSGPNVVGDMAFILDGNSEMGAHVYSEICNSICFRHFFSGQKS